MDDKIELFENMKVSKAIRTLAIPTVISQLINLIYNTVDTYFIGFTGNPHMIGGVTIAFTIFMMTIAFSSLFGVGGGSLIARLMGKQENIEAKYVSAFSFYCAIGIALLYSLLLIVFLDPILNTLGASTSNIEYAKQYVSIVVIAGNLFIILSMTLAHLLRNVGYSKQASFGLSFGGVLNMALDPLFMFVILPKGNEVIGASIATLIANMFSCFYLIYQYKKAGSTMPLSAKFSDAKKISKDSITKLFSVGIPSSLLSGLFDVANIVLNALMAAHGDIELAAMGIVMKAERLPNAINIGICQGMLPLVAYNYASKNHERTKKVIRKARLYGLVIAFISVICFQVFAKPVVSIFLSTKSGSDVVLKTILLAEAFLILRSLASPVQFLNYHTSFCLQAMGDGRDTLIHAVVRIIGIYIPAMFILDKVFGSMGLASGLLVAEFLSAIFALILLRLWLNKHKKTQN